MTDDLEALARAVDLRIHRQPFDRDAGAWLYAVLDDVHEPDGFALRLLRVDDRYEVTRGIRPPSEAIAIALSVCGWAAPLPDPGEQFLRPSVHPRRYRVHQTLVITGDDDDWAILRSPDADTMSISGCCGVVYDLMLDCWHRRGPARHRVERN